MNERLNNINMMWDTGSTGKQMEEKKIHQLKEGFLLSFPEGKFGLVA